MNQSCGTLLDEPKKLQKMLVDHFTGPRFERKEDMDKKIAVRNYIKQKFEKTGLEVVIHNFTAKHYVSEMFFTSFCHTINRKHFE